MYNRYIPGQGGYIRISEEDMSPEAEQEFRDVEDLGPPNQGERPPLLHGPRAAGEDLLRQLTAPLRFFSGENKDAGAAGILKALHLEELDSGDVLLLLIMLLIFLEGDDLELVITLGLMLLFSLNDAKRESQNE